MKFRLRWFYFRKRSITLHNVRNFNWHPDGTYDVRWETRTFDLNQLNGINIITSYWMGPQIAHTLVSFEFKNQQPLVFSIEIRKEKTEEFSAIGGFFRKYELSLIASDEKILSTRVAISVKSKFIISRSICLALSKKLSFRIS